jgi:hypothetical protein
MANGNGDGLLPEGASNPNMGPSTPKLGGGLRGDRKGGKVDGFPLATLRQSCISGVKSAGAGECWAATRWGDHSPAIPASTQRRLRAAATRAGAAGQRPPRVICQRRKRLHGCCSGPSVGTARRIPAPWPGTPARRVRPVIGSAAVLAGVGVDVSRSAVLGFCRRPIPPPSNLFTISVRITVPPHFMCADTLYPPRH